jgi:hypothetical protein
MDYPRLGRLVVGIVFTVIVTVASRAEEKIPLLHAAGESFTNVIVTRTTATDLFILHDGGMATVEVKNLDEATRVRLGLPREVPADHPQDNNASPEFLLGTQIEQAAQTNRHATIIGAFDLDALYARFVPTLPTSDSIKQQILTVPRRDALRKKLFAQVIEGFPEDHLRFLGVRRVGNDCELLFRAWGFYDNSDPCYSGLVTERLPDGSVKLVDVHRFATGELLSQSLRRDTMEEIVAKRLTIEPMTAEDRAFITGAEAWKLFTDRCGYGHYNLIKAAYDQLPMDLQNSRLALQLYASSGEQTVKDILVPIERWRRLYPNDPSPDIMIVDYYWRLYAGPRYVEGPKGGRIEAYASWTPKEEEEAVAAIQKANLWLADPMMEIRLARYYAAERPEKARPLLQQALKHFPPEKAAMAELLKIDLATTNFVEVAETLHFQETTFHTNLTAVVDATPDYAAFRKSFSWKKWQHDYHGADSKTLTASAPSPQAAR